MIKNFEFEEAGRRYICTVETPRHAGMEPWWWYSVATEEGTTRYAPFEAKPTDTQKSVKTRIIAHYEEVLAIKARPVNPRPHWQRPATPPATTPPATTQTAP